MRRFLLLIAALLAYGSLFPWHFEFTSAAGNPVVVLLHGWPPGWNRYILRDIVLNIAIYAPLGFAAALIFRRKHSPDFAAAAAVAFGFLFSVTMELLQVYVPGRDPSLLDVLTNTIGSAAGAVFALRFEADIHRIGEKRASRFRSAAVLLLLIWALCELYPFFPEIGRTHLRQGLALLLRTREFSVVETWANCAEWFAVGLALDSVFARMRTSWLAIVMLCVPAQMVVADRWLTAPEIAGALLALAMWHLVRAEWRARWCAWMLGSAILLKELQPFYFLAVPQPFSWIPFNATLETNRDAATVIVARKAFDYGSMIWALGVGGIRSWWAGLGVAAMLLAAEMVQTYLPGRAPEITDPLLAVMMMLVLSVMSRAVNKAG